MKKTIYMWIIAGLALINAELSLADNFAETNKMPEQIHDLMKAEGYAIDPRNVSIPGQNINLLGNCELSEKTKSIPLEVPMT